MDLTALHAWSVVLLAIASVGLLPSVVAAQQADSLRARMIVGIPDSLDVLDIVARTAPGSSAGSPTAFGPSWGDGYAGLGLTNRARYMPSRPFSEFWDGADGAVSVGFGVGNARDKVGLDVNIASYSTWKRGLGTRMGISFKLHRVFDGNWGVGVGYENAITRGPVDSDPSLFLAVSKVWQHEAWNPFISITGTVGAGDGRFRFERDVAAGKDTWNVFGSVGLQGWQPVSLIADWTGQDLVLGASVVPFELPGMPDDLKDISLVVTAGFADLTGSAGDGVRFILGVGLAFRWDSLAESFP